MGNRGALAVAPDKLGNALWKGTRWISCDPKFGGKKLSLMAPGKNTQLFFLDEAVALAAGHRPCWTCRKGAFVQFKAAWPGNGGVAATEMDRILHKERIVNFPTRQRGYPGRFEDLPNGTFVELDGEAWLVLDSSLVRYTPTGYDKRLDIPSGCAIVITPKSVVEALANGYSPKLH
ncbi:MAG: hypothetical protein OXN89_03210 [Bryobacterales bacterium]|nr:hypothetical protein [Bryobacterales bacterium]